VDVASHAAGNPRLFVGPDSAIWLIAPVNYGRWCDGGTRMFFKRSFDGGQSWSDLEILTTRRRILGKNKPLFIPPGTWILPVEYEGIGDVAFFRSANNGRTWKVIDLSGDGAYLDQPSLVHLSDGTLLAYMRSWEGYIYETRSSDLGLTWTKPIPTPLLNPNSGIDMVRLRSGRLVLIYNPVGLGANGDLTVSRAGGQSVIERYDLRALNRQGDLELARMNGVAIPEDEWEADGLLRWGPRTPLAAGVSDDEGASWRTSNVLEDAPGEYSYPAVIQSAGGAVHVFYTHQRTRMKHVRLEESDLG
jgi:predicted neuraminidase